MEHWKKMFSPSSVVNLIEQTEDEESVTQRFGSPSNHQGSQCASPSSSHVAFVSGERLKTDALWHRRRRSLRRTTRSTMWSVQLSAIVVTLAVAASVALVWTLRQAEGRTQEEGNTGPELNMEDDSAADRNNGTGGIATYALSHTNHTNSTNLDHAPEAAILFVEELIRMARGIAAATTSVVREPGSSSTYDPLTFPSPLKRSGNAATQQNLSALAYKPKRSSSTVNGFGVNEGKDLHPALSLPDSNVERTTVQKLLGVSGHPVRLPNEGTKAAKQTRRLLRLERGADRGAWAQETDVRFWKRHFVV